MATLMLYIFLCFSITFTGSYISVKDNLSGLSSAQVEHIVYELVQEEK